MFAAGMMNASRDVEMEHYLRACKIYESEEGLMRRKHVSQKLCAITTEWAVQLSKVKSIPKEYLVPTINIFGSTRLGVQSEESDIDALCITPMYITFNDFFGSFCQTLATRPDVEGLLPIPEAYTPVIKFVLDGQAIDMVFCSLQTMRLHQNLDVLDLRFLKGLDNQSVRSLNGSRVAEWICKLVPNMKSFWYWYRAYFLNRQNFLELLVLQFLD